MKEFQLEYIHLRSSRWLAAILMAAHAAVLCITLTLPLNPWLIAGTAVLLALSAHATVSRHAMLRRPGSIVRLELTDREHVRVQTRAGAWHSGHILGSSTVGPWLTVLNIRRDDDRRPEHVVLAGDSIEPDALRRLRVWLRWGPMATSNDAGTS